MTDKVVDFAKRAAKEGVGVAPITELVATTFEITAVVINKGLEYDTAIITTKGGAKYRTASDVLREQLVAIQGWLKEPETESVQVSLKQVGRYYTF